MTASPVNTAAVEVRGHEWSIGFDIEEAEEAQQFQFGTIPATGRKCIPMYVRLGTTWHDLQDIFSSDFMDEIEAELNRMPWNT